MFGDLLDYKVNFNVERCFLGEPTDPNDHIVTIEAEILYNKSEVPEIEDYEVVGDATALYFRLENAKWRIFDIFDSETQATYNIYTDLFDTENNCLKKEITKQFDCFDGNILHLDIITIEPEHRGQNLGLLTLQELIKIFGGGCSLITCHPCPLQFDKDDEKELIKSHDYCDFTKDREVALKKLQQYWSKLGVRRVLDTVLFAMTPYESD